MARRAKATRQTKEWQQIGPNSAVERGATQVPVVAFHGSLDVLPFDVLTWQDFESLQWRILRDVEGLRHAQFYGEAGQSQEGLDLIAQAADGSGVALQSKHVKQFGPAKITAAVNAFRTKTRPFEVSRFVIGVSREIRTKAALNRLSTLRTELKPIELELWDQRKLSMQLKGKPDIVIEYFGEAAAKAFCGPFVVGTMYVPAGATVEVREAIARTPEVTTGAGALIKKATDCASSDPEQALELVESAQSLLTTAGFGGHAAKHEALRSSLLVQLGRATTATRRRLDDLWVALDQGQSTHAAAARGDIRGLVGGGDKVDELTRQHLAIANAAVDLYENPLAFVPDLNGVLAGNDSDRARLAVLAGEIALANGNHEWLVTHASQLEELATHLNENEGNDAALRVRLRILAAEGSGQWAPILRDARSLKVGYALAALVQARHARHLALNHQFGEADAAWDEATGSACLAERWTDASRWTFSRRAFRTRWAPFSSDELLPVQTALLARGPGPTVLPRDEEALEYAYGALADNRLREAAISAQRALRDSVTLSDWEGERRSHRVLAAVLSASGEADEAAQHLVRSGSTNQLKRLAEEHPKRFLDVTDFLSATPYWIAGAAYRLIAQQADLVPDSVISGIAEAALRDLAAASAGTLVDLGAFSGSRRLGAIAALAGIANRLSTDHADWLLTHFESQPPVEPDHYRYHDDDEALATAEIAATQPELGDRAIAHLVALLSRSQSSRKPRTVEVITTNIEQARSLLEAFASAGDTWALEVLTAENPEQATKGDIAAARVRLESPLTITPGVITFGSGASAVSDSVMVRTLPATDQEQALTQLIERAANTHVSATDRGSYLIAASNLMPPSKRAARQALFDSVVNLVVSPPVFVADEADAPFRHPLGGFRVDGGSDARAHAAFLAATLARTRSEKKRVRSAAFALIGDDLVSEYWTTRALQRLGDAVAPDVGFLSGLDWAARSLAAILWVRTTRPAPVGYRLASDSDVRVRRALAQSLARHQVNDDPRAGATEPAEDERTSVLLQLRDDPCYSVRAAAKITPSDLAARPVNT